MTTQEWINEQKIQAVQDREDGKDYWRTDNLYTEADLIELLEAFALYSVVGHSEQLRAFKKFLQSEYHLPVSNRMLDEFEQKQSS
jgi:hypothetical protein